MYNNPSDNPDSPNDPYLPDICLITLITLYICLYLSGIDVPNVKMVVNYDIPYTQIRGGNGAANVCA